MLPPRAYLPEGTPNYVTKEGLEALNEELKSLEVEQAKAGDNYIMSNFIEAKMKLLINRINSAVEIDPSKVTKDTVGFGAWVRYNGHVVRIVGVDEANVKKGLVAFTSPIAKALMGKKKGDVIALKGTERMVVEDVSYEPMALTQMESDKPSPSFPKEMVSTAKKGPVQIDQTQQEAQEHHTDVPTATNGLRRFEPEVDVMEFLPIVNERGIIVGRALYVELHNGNKMLHPVIHLHVLNSKGETTRRYWWHVAFGDTPEKTLKRKMEESLRLSGVKPKLKRQYIREAKSEKELVYVFTLVSEEDLPSTPEGEDYRKVFEKD